MIPHTINFKRVLEVTLWLWSKSLPVMIALLLGLWIGSVNTESRIVSDCKFANAFRVEIQAFACQRKL
jgi:hypothetical protein